jgi:hypothetical protein
MNRLMALVGDDLDEIARAQLGLDGEEEEDDDSGEELDDESEVEDEEDEEDVDSVS